MRKENEKDSIAGFEFLPAESFNNSIEIFPPFASLVSKEFIDRNLDITQNESGAINISFENMDKERKTILLKELRTFLKKSRQHVIDNFLIYKTGRRNYL